MTENERKAIDTLKDMIAEGQYNGADIVARDDEEELKTAIQALEEIQQYRAMEQRLQNIYGECDGLLETVVQHLEKHENIKLPDNIIKARLLTDENVDKWEQLKGIGTIEKFKALKEKSVAKKPITYAHTHRADCPNCKATVRGIDKPFGDYCSKCGIKLDWSE